MLYGDAVRNRIKKLANERKITIHKLSTLAGVSHSTLSAFMNGDRKDLKSSTILHICEGLNIKLWEFYKDSIFDDVKDE